MTDADKLAQAKELLQRMIVSAECFTAHDAQGEQFVIGYRINTGALHQLAPLLGCYLLSNTPVTQTPDQAKMEAVRACLSRIEATIITDGESPQKMREAIQSRVADLMKPTGGLIS